MYTKSPQDFNAMIKSMSSFTNQVSGTPLYQGAYLPTNVPGQAYGGSQSDWSQSAYSANSPYYPAGKSFTQANPQGGAPPNSQTSFNPYGQQQNPYMSGQGSYANWIGQPQNSSAISSNLAQILQMIGSNYGNGRGYQSPQYVGVGGNQSRYGTGYDPGLNPFTPEYSQWMQNQGQYYNWNPGGQQTPNYYGY
jgi:hypothetical protein